MCLLPNETHPAKMHQDDNLLVLTYWYWVWNLHDISSIKS